MLNSNIIGKICIHNYNTITIFNLEFYVLVELMLQELRGKYYYMEYRFMLSINQCDAAVNTFDIGC